MPQRLSFGAGFFALILFWGGAARGSAESDTRYAFQNLVPSVVNLAAHPVYGAHIQSELDAYFASRHRFGPADAAAQALRQQPGAPSPTGLLASTDASTALADFVAPALAAGADSALLVELRQDGESYFLDLLAVVFNPLEPVYRGSVAVEDRYALRSFSSALQQGLSAFVASLPFDATVLQREGYRVILDRGGASFAPNSRVAVYTVEPGRDGPHLVETGVVLINRVDPNLSFGTILVENKPAEVQKGNKVRFQGLGSLHAAQGHPLPSGSQSQTREPNSAAVESVSAGVDYGPSALGRLDVQLVGNFISWNRTAAGTGEFRSDGGFYPGASVRVQGNLSRRLFIEGAGFFGLASLVTQDGSTTRSLASDANQIRANLGYQLAIAGEQGLGPVVHLRAGYTRSQYGVEATVETLGPTSSVFSGFTLGAGLDYPFTQTVGMGVEMNALIAGGFSEPGPTSGGQVQNVSGWDFAVRGTYRLSSQLQMEARMVFQTHTTGFLGAGERAVSLSSLSLTSRALTTGLSYTF